MKIHFQLSVFALAASLLFTLSCAPPVTYDPAKTYAAVIAIDLPTARSSMDDIKQKSADLGFELGPIEYYQPGYADFVPLVNKLTSRAHVGLLWVAGGLEDIQRIQDAIATAGYMGQTRLAPVYPPSPFHPTENINKKPSS